MMNAARIAQQSSDFRFEISDNVVCRSNHSLVGEVSRTPHDIQPHESVAHFLVVSHIPVAQDAVRSFLKSGTPPKGHVFVQWSQIERGYSLVPDQALRLLGRKFILGDNVKRNANDAMIGTVVSISESHVLRPICHPLHESELRPSRPGQKIGWDDEYMNCSDYSHPEREDDSDRISGHNLLYDVPGRDIKPAQDFPTGGHVLEQDYLGLIDEAHLEAVILLDNDSVVVVDKAWDLKYIVPPWGKVVVQPPLIVTLRMPGAKYFGGEMFVPVDQVSRGQHVRISHKRLRQGRWRVGEYDPSCIPEGRILDVRARRIDMKVICPNPYSLSDFIGHLPASVAQDRSSMISRVHHNYHSGGRVEKTFSTKSLTLLDRNQPPVQVEQNQGEEFRIISMSENVEPGSQVRFRDPAQLLKYERKSSGESEYRSISKDLTYGYDLNEFTVLYSTQIVAVCWQDGSQTEEQSVFLRACVFPEQDLCPGDVITLKEGTTQKEGGAPDSTSTPFNEMAYYMRNDFILCPKRVGVVQAVDARERLTRVRWFLDPSIKLLHGGHTLHMGSRFGPISNISEDVSLYEIMSHPALMRRRRDLVLLPPQIPNCEAMEAIYHLRDHTNLHEFGATEVSHAVTSGNVNLYDYLRQVAKPIMRRDMKEQSHFGMFETSSMKDWLGEIVDLGLDGLLTIRLSGLSTGALDVRISRDRVIGIIEQGDELDFSDGYSYHSSNENGSNASENSTVTPIEETVEYEGGIRLDDESGDEEWTTDDENEEKPKDKIKIDEKQSIEEEPPDMSESEIKEWMEKQQALRMQTIQTLKRIDRLVSGEDSPANEDEFLSPRPQSSSSTTIPPPTQQNTQMSAAQPTSSMFQSPSATAGERLKSVDPHLQPPPSFAILESEPPSDQYGSNRPIADTVGLTGFLKRVTREHKFLSTSLPSSPFPQIFVRSYTSRLDLFRALIIGAADTPYEFAPFLVDIALPATYPRDPPAAHFHSWTSGLGRVNPNLYEEGKICLSLLGTWPGRGKGEDDTWSEKSGSILQVLLSIMGLVLVQRPFYNEAGFEREDGGEDYQTESLLYSEKAYVLARGFVKIALCEWGGLGGFEDVLAWLYLSKKGPIPPLIEFDDVDTDTDGDITMHDHEGKLVDQTQLHRPELLKKLISRAKSLMENSMSTSREEQVNELVDGAGERNVDAFLQPLSQGAVVMLRRHLGALERSFDVE